MKDKIDTLFDYIKTLCESDLDRIIQFVLGIVSINQQPQDRPDCPYCGSTHTIKYGHRRGKQRFMVKRWSIPQKNMAFLTRLLLICDTKYLWLYKIFFRTIPFFFPA